MFKKLLLFSMVGWLPLQGIFAISPEDDRWVQVMATQYIPRLFSPEEREKIKKEEREANHRSLATLGQSDWLEKNDALKRVKHSDGILEDLKGVPHGSRLWFGEMATLVINTCCDEEITFDIFKLLRNIESDLKAQDFAKRICTHHITGKTSQYERRSILRSSSEVMPDERDWFEGMAAQYDYCGDTFLRYCKGIPISAREVFEKLSIQYLDRRRVFRSPPMDFPIMFTLEYIKMLSCERTGEEATRIERIAGRYLPPRFSFDKQGLKLMNVAQRFRPKKEVWVENATALYINASFQETELIKIVYALDAVPKNSRPWFKGMMQFLIEPKTDAPARANVSESLQRMIVDFGEDPEMLEQFRLRVIGEVNVMREKVPLITWEQLSRLFPVARDFVTEQRRFTPRNGYSRGRATEVHFACSLELPVEGRDVPLYQAVEACLRESKYRENVRLPRGLGILQGWVDIYGLPIYRWVEPHLKKWVGSSGELTLINAVTIAQNWVTLYALEENKELYHHVITKGYGDGRDPGFNQELTPLLRFVVPYIQKLSPDVQSAWLLPALEESATAYGSGDISCGKGIQERLTILSFDVEGINPALRSISKFARTFVYLTDPNIYGADTWVRDATPFLEEKDKVLLLAEQKPNQQIFKDMFWVALEKAFKQSGLLPLHVAVVLRDDYIKKSLNLSLDMHYEYDNHYATLQNRLKPV